MKFAGATISAQEVLLLIEQRLPIKTAAAWRQDRIILWDSLNHQEIENRHFIEPDTYIVLKRLPVRIDPAVIIDTRHPPESFDYQVCSQG
jgi:hypothetical protein